MFETPCSTDEPELRRTEAGEIACHIHDPAYEGEPGGLPTDDGNDKKTLKMRPDVAELLVSGTLMM